MPGLAFDMFSWIGMVGVLKLDSGSIDVHWESIVRRGLIP